ncbi:MAG TPA: hypothetical protein VJ998_06855, partial [Pseudomonadales bacterium]|nr:hypothetical protein [Pseudomonadales bacterium]
MANKTGNAYGLITLSPIRRGVLEEGVEFVDKVRDILQDWNFRDNSPMSQVPETYLCRYFVLDDVFTQSLPGGSAPDTIRDFWPFGPGTSLPHEDHLQSAYLVFCCSLYGGPNGNVEGYLKGMWTAMSEDIKSIWKYCYGFEQVNDANSFMVYMKKCQMKTSLFFVGANDAPLAEQLKGLYLKQELARFAIDNQGLDAATLRANFTAFMARVNPENLTTPTWTPG